MINNNFAIEIDNKVYYFYMGEDFNIYFKEISDKTVGDERILIENSLSLISVQLNDKNTIYLFIETQSNELVLYEFTQGIILAKKVLAKGFISSTYMKIVSVNNSLHLFYSEKVGNYYNIYHCLLTKDSIFSSPIFIDKVLSSNFDPFIINISTDYLFISYIKFSNCFEYIYRTYDLNRNIWNSNNIIDTSYSPISAFDMILSNEYILYYYQTHNNSDTLIFFGYGLGGNFIKGKIIEERETAISSFIAMLNNTPFLTYYKPSSKKLKVFQIIFNFDEILEMDLSDFISIKRISMQTKNKLISNSAFLIEFESNYIFTNTVFFNDILPKTTEDIYSENKISSDLNNRTEKKSTSSAFEKDQLIKRQTNLIRELQQQLLNYEEKLKSSINNNPENEEINNLQKQITALLNNIKNKDYQLSNVEMLLDKNEKYIAELEAEIARNTKLIADFHSQFESVKNITLNDQILCKNKEIADLLDEISELKSQLYNNGLLINELENTIKQKDRHILDLREELKQLNAVLKSITEKNSELERKVNQSIIRKLFSKDLK